MTARSEHTKRVCLVLNRYLSPVPVLELRVVEMHALTFADKWTALKETGVLLQFSVAIATFFLSLLYV